MNHQMKGRDIMIGQLTQFLCHRLLMAIGRIGKITVNTRNHKPVKYEDIFIAFIVSIILLLPSTEIALAGNIENGENIENYAWTPFILEKLGFGDYNKLIGTQIAVDYIRTSDPGCPGYYYINPSRISAEIDIDSTDVEFIRSLILPYLADNYYDDAIFNFLQNYYLLSYQRKEFYINIRSSHVPIKISGWYGKFIHIIVDAEFDSNESFLTQAAKYFNLPPLDTKNVKADYFEKFKCGDKNEYFYSYDDNSKDFKLVGYTVLNAGTEKCEIEKTVLDLTIYAPGGSDGKDE